MTKPLKLSPGKRKLIDAINGLTWSERSWAAKRRSLLNPERDFETRWRNDLVRNINRWRWGFESWWDFLEPVFWLTVLLLLLFAAPAYMRHATAENQRLKQLDPFEQQQREEQPEEPDADDFDPNDTRSLSA